MRYLFLLLLFGGFANAADFWLYSYGDVTTLKQVFNYLAMVKQDKSYMTLLEVSIASGIVITATFKRFSPYSSTKTFAGAILIITAIFQTTCTVHITNVHTYENALATVNERNYAAVDNVPYIVGFLASTFKTIGYSSTRLIENGFHFIGDGEYQATSFLKVGTLGSYKIFHALQNIDFEKIDKVGAEFDGYYNEYQNECIKDIAYPLNRNRVHTLIVNSKNILADTNPHGKNELINVVKNQKIDTSLGAMTCGDFYTILANKEKLLHESIKQIVHDRLKNYTGDVFEASSAAVKLFAGAQGNNPEEQVVNYVLANAQMRSFIAPWKDSEQQGAYGASLAETQLQQMGKVNAQTAANVIPLMHSILEAIIYVAAPFLLLFGLASFNIQQLKIYLQSLIWIEMWPPSFSILNSFIEYEGATEATDKLINAANRFPSDQMLTYVSLSTASDLYSGIANTAAFAAHLLWSVPLLSAFLMYGSFSVLQGLTSGIAATTSQAGILENQMDQKALAMATDRMNQSLNMNMSAGEAMSMSKLLNNVDNFSRLNAFNKMGLDRYGHMKSNENLYNNSEKESFYNSLGSEKALIGSADFAGKSKATNVQTQNQTYKKDLSNFGTEENMIDQVSNANAFNKFNSTNLSNETQAKYDQTSSKVGDANGDGIVDFRDTSKHISKGLADDKTANDMGITKAALETNDDTQMDAQYKNKSVFYHENEDIPVEDLVTSAKTKKFRDVTENLVTFENEKRRASENGQTWKEYVADTLNQLSRNKVLNNEAIADSSKNVSDDDIYQTKSDEFNTHYKKAEAKREFAAKEHKDISDIEANNAVHQLKEETGRNEKRDEIANVYANGDVKELAKKEAGLVNFADVDGSKVSMAIGEGGEQKYLEIDSSNIQRRDNIKSNKTLEDNSDIVNNDNYESNQFGVKDIDDKVNKITLEEDLHTKDAKELRDERENTDLLKSTVEKFPIIGGFISNLIVPADSMIRGDWNKVKFSETPPNQGKGDNK